MKKNNLVLGIIRNPMGRSFLLNLVYMGGMLLFFTPFLSIDDYVMSQYAYGAFSDDYDYCVRYENFIYGRLITCLMRILPKVPWYTVLFYIWIFIALTLLCYIILVYFDNYLGVAIANVILIFFCYEGYVGIQFTKVAGIIGAVGIFSLVCSRVSWKCKTCGMFLFLIAGLIRYEVLKMILGAWICALILKFIFDFLAFHSIRLGKKQLTGIAIGIIIFLLIPYLPQYSSLEEKDFWNLYWEYNTIRASIQDYGYPPYAENKEAYDDAGISENDLYLWYSWNMDPDALTLEKGKKIWAIRAGTYEFSGDEESTAKAGGTEDTEETEKMEEGKTTEKIATLVTDRLKSFFQKYNLKSVFSYLKEFPKAFLNIDVCFCVIFVEMLVFLCCKMRRRTFWEAAIVPGAVLLALNYYLFVSGRYLQHRVDVGIFMVVCSIFMFIVIETGNIEVETVKKPAVFGLGICLMLFVPYQYYSDDRRTVSQETIATNKILFEQFGNEGDACYYFAANRQDGNTSMRVYYDVFEVPEVGSAKNCFFANSIYDKKRMSELFGIDQIFIDMVDSEDIYFVMSEKDTNLSAWETYLTERNGKEIELVLVKNYLGRKIYRARSVAKKLETPQNIRKSENVESELATYRIADGRIYLDGNVHLKGESGFRQESYMQIIDSQSGETQIWAVTQTCDESKSLEEDGYFSRISTSVELPEFYDDSDTVNLLIEEEGSFYCVNLQ